MTPEELVVKHTATPLTNGEMIQYIRQMIAEEREACARIADDAGNSVAHDTSKPFDAESFGEDIAAAIRARP